MLFSLIYLAVVVLMFVSMWKVFVKAGQPGPVLRELKREASK